MALWSRSKAVVASALRLPGNLPASISRQGFGHEYSFDPSTVDVRLARALYNNVEPRYKLGAGFSRPAINVPVGFMGTPIFQTESSEAQDVLDSMSHTWSGDILRAHVALLRDGEILVRARYANRSPAYAGLFGPEDDLAIEVGYHQAGTFDVETLDEDAGAITAFKITHAVIVEENGYKVEKKIFETVYPDRVIIEWENNFRPRREEPNGLGFVSAVLMRNDNEADELHGRSELEPLEPYMRFYNDVMLHAGSASKLHSTAKMNIRVKDLNTFLSNNFTAAEIAEGRLRFKDKDILFFETGVPEIGLAGGGAAFQEGADIVQARAPLGDTNTLLEYIFLNIVDVSEVPEWAFGGAIASSKASVSEQSAPLVHKVSRKRTQVENSWALFGRMALKMADVSAPVTVAWDDLAQRDTKSEADAIRMLSDAFVALVDAEIMSKEAAVEHLRPFVPSLLQYIVEDNGKGEKDRIESEQADQQDTGRAILDALLNPETEENDRQAGLTAVG